jgi:hypothetical protein
VHPRLSLIATRKGALIYTFAGRTSAGTPAGQAITLYRLVGGRELRLASTRTMTSGRYEMTYRFPVSGSARVLTRSGRTSDTGAGQSALYDLTVR